MLQKTLVILKPDAVARKLAGRIITRFEEKGLKITAMHLTTLTDEVAKAHYKQHEKKPFFSSLIDFITSGPVVLMAIEGVDIVEVVRRMVGDTLGRTANPGTIRGDFSMSQSFNLVHASDSPEAAERELALFFPDKSFFVKSPTQRSLRWNYDFSEDRPI